MPGYLYEWLKTGGGPPSGLELSFGVWWWLALVELGILAGVSLLILDSLWGKIYRQRASLALLCTIRNTPLFQNILLSVGVFGFLWLLTEGVYGIRLLLREPTWAGTGREQWIGPHPALGYAPFGGPRSVNHIKIAPAGDTIFQAVYTLNRQNERTVVPSIDSTHTTIHLFGCSFTFGEGCTDGHTLGDYIVRNTRQTRVENHAFNGYGPQHALVKALGLPKDTTSGEVLGLYVYIDHHPPRVWPTFQTVEWLWNTPVFPDSGSGRLRHTNKPFYQVAPWRCFGLGLMRCSAVLRWLMPRRLTEAAPGAVHTSVQLLHETATVFKNCYPRSTFRVLLVPSAFTAAMGYETTHRPELLEYLNAYQLNYLDLGKTLHPGHSDSLSIERYAIIDDGHPNPRGQEFLALRIIEWLNLQK